MQKADMLCCFSCWHFWTC